MSKSTNPQVGDEIVVDLSKMAHIGYGDHIARGNAGNNEVIIKVTQVDSDGSGFGVCRSVLPIGGHMILCTEESIVGASSYESAGWQLINGLVTLG